MNVTSWKGWAASAVLLCSCGGGEGATDTNDAGTQGASTSQGDDPDSGAGSDGDSGGDSADATGADSAGQTDATTGEDETASAGNESSTGGAQPSDLDAFRIGTIQFRDPHFFAPVLGDVTASVVNTGLNENISQDDPDEPDGYLDLGWVLLFDELDQGDGATNAFTFANARCTAPVDGTECSLVPGTMMYDAPAEVTASGSCGAIDQGHLSSYDTEPGPPTPTPGPCFTATGVDITVIGTSFELPLTDVSAAAQFSGDPAQALIEGNMVGFLHEDTAAQTQVNLAGIGSIPISGLLREEDKDGDGWWMYLSFTAQRTSWSG